ncbi:DUF4230 domain-containing protein [bacterium]|nr:DUF4230 domain-containing protein [bacterium]
MLKRLKFYTVSIVIAALAAAVAYLSLVGPPSAGVRLAADPPAIVREIQQLQELVTVKHSIQKVVGLKEEKIPFGSEQILLMVRAEVLAGVDLAGLTDADVAVAPDRTVNIRLPAPRVMHVYINDQETRIWDRQKTWWTPWVPFNPELDQKARLLALESVQAAALDMGILRDAQANAERSIRRVLSLGGLAPVRFAPREPARPPAAVPAPTAEPAAPATSAEQP